MISSDTSPRVALYRLFHQLWGSANVDLRSVASSRPQPAAGVEKKLGELTPARRQALLLTAMEGFNVGDTAPHPRRSSEEEVKQMVAQAVREISDQPSTKVLIIEDEPIISLDLQSIVREMGHTRGGDRHARGTRP